MKTCNMCNVEKNESEFYFSKTYVNNHCKKCNNEKSKEWYAKNKDVKLASSLKWHYKDKYGITMEQRQELFDKQLGKCAICSCEIHLDGTLDAKRAVIDHNHKTGKVRGMLCNLCNQGIGRFKDNTKLIQNAINYLEKHHANLVT
jgi:hypothetical protein